MSSDAFGQALGIRDAALDAWLGVCSPEERRVTAEWMLMGGPAAAIPQQLRQAQARLMEVMEAQE
jgi:hypothetical protein